MTGLFMLLIEKNIIMCQIVSQHTNCAFFVYVFILFKLKKEKKSKLTCTEGFAFCDPHIR